MKRNDSNWLVKLLCGPASLAVGLWASSAGAAVITEETFNYASGSTLQNQSGGSGWFNNWSVDQGANSSSTAVGGLTYSEYSIGSLASGAGSVGTGTASGELGAVARGIGDHAVQDTYWIRALYQPGTTDPASGGSVTPLMFQGANSGDLNGAFSLSRNRGTLNMQLDMTVGNGGTGVSDSQSFSFADAGPHMLLWKLSVQQNGIDTLETWVDPTGNSAGLPASALAHFTLQADMLAASGGFDDILGAFSSSGYGDIIDEIKIGTLISDVAAVPEPGAIAMSCVVLLGVGGVVVRYRATKKANPKAC